MKWIDTSEYDFLLTALKLSDGKNALVLTGLAADENGEFADKFKALKFVRTKSNLWFTLHYSTPDGLFNGLDLATIHQHFPLAVERDISEFEVFRSPTEIKDLLTKSVRPIAASDITPDFDTQGYADTLSKAQRKGFLRLLSEPIQFQDNPLCSRYELINRLIDQNYIVDEMTMNIAGHSVSMRTLQRSEHDFIGEDILHSDAMNYASYLYNKKEDKLINQMLQKHGLPTFGEPATVIDETIKEPVSSANTNTSIASLPDSLQQEYLDAEDELMVILNKDHPYYLAGDLRETRKKKALHEAEKLPGDYRVVHKFDYSEWYVRPQNSCAVMVLFPIQKGELSPKKDIYYAEDKGDSIALTYLSKVASENIVKTFHDLKEMSEWISKGGVLKAEEQLSKQIAQQKVAQEQERIALLPFLQKERDFLHGSTVEELITKDIEYVKEQLSASRRNCTFDLSSELSSRLQVMREHVADVTLQLENAVKNGVVDFNKIPKTYPFTLVELIRVEQDKRFSKLTTESLDIEKRDDVDPKALALLKKYGVQYLNENRKEFSHLIQMRMEACDYALGKRIYHYQNKNEQQYRQLLDSAIKLSGKEEVLVEKMIDTTNYINKQEFAAAELLDSKGLTAIQEMKETLDHQIRQRMRDTHREFGNNAWDYMTDAERDNYHIFDIAIELHKIKQEQLKEFAVVMKK